MTDDGGVGVSSAAGALFLQVHDVRGARLRAVLEQDGVVS